MEIGRGAEAIVTLDSGSVTKERVSKGYRLDVLDKKLRVHRTRHEAKILEKLHAAGVCVPAVKSVDEKSAVLEMEHVSGKVLKDVLDADVEKYGPLMGELLASIHLHGVVHQDVTTSNMIASDDLVMIDFGLSFFSVHREDRAVDLHLLERALAAKHASVYDTVWPLVRETYFEAMGESSGEIRERFETVQKRGRNKH